eukprot:2593560-Rhodomonas_salina.5
MEAVLTFSEAVPQRQTRSSSGRLRYLPTHLLCDVRYGDSVWCDRGTRVLWGMRYGDSVRWYAMCGTEIAYGAVCLRDLHY